MRDEWMPISTAPKAEDREWRGPRLLLTDGAEVACGRWDGWEWTNEAEIVWLGDDGVRYETWHPTHWMHLPEPPK